MRKARESGKDHFDLLPFIAILMCTLGCLLFVTMSIAALSLGPGRGEGWIPVTDSSKMTKTPILVVFDGKKVEIHQEDGKIVSTSWESGSITIDNNGKRQPTGSTITPEFQQFLEWMYTRKATHYALLAVRPSGFKEMDLFLEEFRYRDIGIGAEPIDQGRSVRLLKEVKP